MARITPHHLASLLGLARRRVSQLSAGLEQHDLLSAHRTEGMRRLVLTDGGRTQLPCRDRTAAGMPRKRWSASLLDPEEPLQWRNLRGRRTRQLPRNLTRTEAADGFLAALADQASSTGRDLAQIDPPQRASCYFRYEDRPHSCQPDAFGVLSHGGRIQTFFL